MSFAPLALAIMQQKRKNVVNPLTLRGYSVRKLSSTYTGYCMEVRRSSDDTTLNIGFRNGVLDTFMLLTFVGAGSGYVRTWYDQSNNPINAVQTTNASQPRIVLNGILDVQNNIPAIYFNNTWLELETPIVGDNDFSTFTVITKNTGATNAFGIATKVAGANGPYSIHLYKLSGIEYVYCCNTKMSSYIIDSAVFQPHLYANLAIDYVNHLYKDGAFKILNNPGGTFPYNFDLIGKRGNDLMDGWLQEILWWQEGIENREDIELNITNFYNLPFNTTIPGQEITNFLNITGITDETIIDAIQTLYDSLVSNGLWNKFVAIYPFVGGSADTHKYNLKDPRDDDSAYRLTFYGGITHGSTGATPNGSTGYADTHLSGYNLYKTSLHLSYYSRTSVGNANQRDIGNGDIFVAMIIRFTNGLFYSQLGGNVTVSNSNTKGFFIVSKSTPGKVSAYRNDSVLMNEVTTTDVNPGNQTMYLFAGKWNTIQGFSTKECAFASIGYGLTPTEAGIFNTIVQTFQTALGRNV